MSETPAAPALLSFEEATQRLLSPGSPFELAEEEVLGEKMLVYKNRLRSLRQMLEQSAAHGEKDYIVFSDGRRWSYAEHLKDVASLAAALRDRYGIQKGDHVAILAANTPEWVLTYWATVCLGGVVISMNGWWAGDEIRYGLDLSKPKLLLVDRRRKERLDEMEGEPGMPVVVFEDDFQALIDHAPDASLPDTPIEEDDPCLLLSDERDDAYHTLFRRLNREFIEHSKKTCGGVVLPPNI